KGKLAAVEEEAKANDPRALKDEIRRLNNALAKALKAVEAPPAPQIIHANADEIEQAEAVARQEGIAEGLQRAVEAISAVSGARPMPRARARASTGLKSALPVQRAPEGPVIAAAGLTQPQQRVLNALA